MCFSMQKQYVLVLNDKLPGIFNKYVLCLTFYINYDFKKKHYKRYELIKFNITNFTTMFVWWIFILFFNVFYYNLKKHIIIIFFNVFAKINELRKKLELQDS